MADDDDDGNPRKDLEEDRQEASGPKEEIHVYARLCWDRDHLSVMETDGQHRHHHRCLDLSKTHSLPSKAFDMLPSRWEKIRFNLTDGSVFDWLCREDDESPEALSDTARVVLCLPGPRGFESVSTPSTRRRNRRRDRRDSREDENGLGRGIDGFLRRQVEKFSFQKSVTRWTGRADSFVRDTRPGPLWWPSKEPVRLQDHEDRLLDIVEMMPNLRVVSVVLGPFSRTGYRRLDDLATNISGGRRRTSLEIHYVDEDGREDASLRVPNCDRDTPNKIEEEHEKFEALRRVDGASLQFCEWTKWLIWVALNLVMWLAVLRVFFWLVLGA